MDDERLALTGLHLGDPAEVQGGAAHHLDVVVALADDAVGGLAGDGERLDQEVVEGGTVVEALAELAGLGLQVVVGQALAVVGSSALMSGTMPCSALSFLPSPARRMRSRMLMRPTSLPVVPHGRGRLGTPRGQAAAGYSAITPPTVPGPPHHGRPNGGGSAVSCWHGARVPAWWRRRLARPTGLPRRGAHGRPSEGSTRW